MASISVTYNFSNGTTSDADQVDQNFTDIINGTSDGTKDFSIAALTCSGNVALNGSTTTIGNASSDSLVITASLGSTIPIGTTNTYNIGSAGLGLASIYLSSSASHTTRVLFGSGVANITWTLPGTNGVNGQTLVNNGSGTWAYSPHQMGINAVSDSYTVLTTDGYRLILVTCGGTDRTVLLPAVASSTNRILVIKKVDGLDSDGTGKLTIDGADSEQVGGANTQLLFSAGDVIELHCDGSAWQITRMVQTEYVYNSSVTDASDTSSFGYGSGGGQFALFTQERSKTVRFLNSISALDDISLQVSRDTGVTWVPLGQLDHIMNYTINGSVEYGIGLEQSSSTDMIVFFARYRILASGGTFGSAGTNWAAIDNDTAHLYRVVKRKII